MGRLYCSQHWDVVELDGWKPRGEIHADQIREHLKMALRLTSASSMRLFNAAPVLASGGYPLTIGLWFKCFSTGATMASFADNGTTTNFIEIAFSGSGPAASVNDGSGVASAVSANNVVALEWHFVLARFINSTNRWINHINRAGAVSSVQNTTSKAPTGLDNISVGARGASTPTSFFNGAIGEFWYLDSDLAADPAAAIPSEFLMEIALRGPFILPNSIDNIVEWRGFRQSTGSDTDTMYDVFSRVGRQTWQYSATPPILTDHPPLSTGYVRPGQSKFLVMP